MSKNNVTKDELKVYVLKLKHKAYYDKIPPDQKQIVNKYLDNVLFKLEEYAY